MCSVWFGGGAGVPAFIRVPDLSSVFVPLPLLCLLVIPAECRGAERCGGTHYAVVRAVLCLAVPAFGCFWSVVRITWLAVSVR